MTITLLLFTLFLLPTFTTAGRLRETREDEKNAPCDQTTKSTIRQIDGGIWQTCDGNGVWKNRFCRSCEMNDRTINCVGLPIHAERNTATSVTQSWDREKLTRLPSIFGKYNTTVSSIECRFKCASGYQWSGKSCVISTRQVNCTGLLANAEWNTATGITQTRNGTDWLPSAMGSYNIVASTGDCIFKCSNGYDWSGSGCVVSNRYPGCNTDDIKVGNYTISACNVGASVAGTSSTSCGSYFTFNNAQTACAAGYHLPTTDERIGFVYTYFHDIKGLSDYTTSTRQYSLSATLFNDISIAFKFPMCGENGGNVGKFSVFWSSSAPNASNGYRMDLASGYIRSQYTHAKTDTISVRCFKNS